MHIIIIGCGKLGSKLGRDLADDGNDICIIDRDSEKLASLGSGFNGQRIRGIEYDSDKLAEAGVNEADVLLAVTADDNINITVSLIAEKIYNVPQIIARVNDPDKKNVYDTLEIETIDPVEYETEVLQSKLIFKNLQVISFLDDDFEVIDFLVSKQKTITVEEVEAKCSCIISGLIRDGLVRLPEKNGKIHVGDRLICTILKKDKKGLINLLGKEIVL